ncbi:sterol homeostasis protein [Marasmius tenuissimus]|nr:sterol homeostasis protein [Marasmius tenuissimus]
MRLEQCPECHAFADPYVEHDTLTLLIDLILLKRGVYRHLLYNRGAKPRRAVEGRKGKGEDSGGQAEEEPKVDDWERESARWALVFRLGLTLISVDAFIRWSYLSTKHPERLTNLGMILTIYTRFRPPTYGQYFSMVT